MLGYYDPKKALTLKVDSSKDESEHAWCKRVRPIAFASKSLTETEKGYAQIEKELYAILIGLKRFHQFTYGRRIYGTFWSQANICYNEEANHG